MKEIIKEKKLVNKGYGYIYLDSQPVNIALFKSVCMRIREYIKVSNMVIQIRLEELGYLQRGKYTKEELIKITLENFLNGSSMN